ncbi:MAG TPA: GNAT family N-acetyltransferase [Solirubrobacteraceae bacterium]|jgi:predicted GNAT family N-acyltransferase|nr:GNAT family N-acetyltransferase [Solirubrobacteraceae bacterium]
MRADTDHTHDDIDSAPVEVRWWRSEQELQSALELRDRVFHGEQGVSREEDLDGLDEHAMHVVALAPGGSPAAGPDSGEALEQAVAVPDGARLVGTLRMVVDGERAKIGRVAVAREWRRRGIASRMLELAVARARELGCARVRLAAQKAAADVYRQAGFAVESDEFEEAGIPHVWMGLTFER